KLTAPWQSIFTCISLFFLYRSVSFIDRYMCSFILCYLLRSLDSFVFLFIDITCPFCPTSFTCPSTILCYRVLPFFQSLRITFLLFILMCPFCRLPAFFITLYFIFAGISPPFFRLFCCNRNCPLLVIPFVDHRISNINC